MELTHLLSSFPLRLPVGAGADDVTYELAADLFAVHGTEDRGSASMTLPAERIRVFPARDFDQEHSKDHAIGPVYRAIGSGALAVPTGRVFVRFAEGETAERHKDRLTEEGFVVEQTPSYAPHAAWVRAKSGRIGDALERLVRLTRLPRVEKVEPQMLRQAARRAR